MGKLNELTCAKGLADYLAYSTFSIFLPIIFFTFLLSYFNCLFAFNNCQNNPYYKFFLRCEK